MMARVRAIGAVGAVLSLVVLAPIDRADAGGSRAAPAVRIVSPAGAGIALERDDLPPPQLEVTRHPARVDVPAIPGFEPPAAEPDRHAASARPEGLAEAPAGAPADPPLRGIVDDVTYETSIGHLNACNRAIAARRYDAAIPECRAATDAWQDNHLAWYATASAHLARQDWPQARAAVEHAVTLRPDRAMYQLYHGIALYEAERQRIGELHARGEPAQRDARQLHAARDALAIAVERAPDLWRAHYYLGRVHRDLDDARRAAEQFTLAIKLQPGYRLPYIALCELYRRWDYVDQALAVATLGTTRVPQGEAAELWFEVGMAHDARHADDLAIDAFSRAIASGDDALPKLQRGQLYLRKGDLGRAQRDLGDVMQSLDPRAAGVKPLVATLLAQIARGQRSTGPHWDCSRGDTPMVCRAR